MLHVIFYKITIKTTVFRRHFYEAIVDVPMKIKETRWQDLVVGVICMIILHSMKIIKQKYTDPKDFPRDSPVASVFRKILWFVCTARNAFVIVIVSCIAFGVDSGAEHKYFTLTGINFILYQLYSIINIF